MVTVQSTTTSDSVTIQVMLTVTAGSALNVTGTLSDFIFQVNSGILPPSQSLMISTTNGELNYSVTKSATAPQNTNWLELGQVGGRASTSPQALTLSLSSQYVEALSPGTYTINVVIMPTGPESAPPPVPVTLIVTNDGLLNVSVNTLAFSIPFGVGSQSKLITVTSSGTTAIPYTVMSTVSNSDQNWLTVGPNAADSTSGTTTGTFVVTVNSANLAASATPYVGTVTVYPQNNDFNIYNRQITVSLTVTEPSTPIYAAPDALLFSQQTGQPAPGVQLVELNSGSPVGFTVATAVITPPPATVPARTG